MARDLDGTNDQISVGSDAAVDNLTTITAALWGVFDATGLRVLANKGPGGWSFWIRGPGGSHRLRFEDYGWSGGDAWWDSTTGITATGQRYHLAVTYDAGSPTNDPSLYINALLETLSVDTNSSGTQTGDDSANSLLAGEDSGGSGDVDGRLACFLIHNGVLTAAEINRAMWWGRPRGGLTVYHPFWTDKLANEGTATADATPTGTTVAAMAIPTVRPGTAMMGCGVGW